MDDNIHKLSAILDDGPLEYLLASLIETRKATTKPLSEWYCDFRQEIKFQSLELASLIQEYAIFKTKDASMHEETLIKSTGSWIHYSNKIEFAGFEELAHTLATVKSQDLRIDDPRTKDVLQTLKLVKQIYTPEVPVSEKPNLFEVLDSWHTRLFDTILPEFQVGKVRKGGTETTTADGSIHKYPHHTVLQHGVWMLSDAMRTIFQDVDQHKNELTEHIIYSFAAAAFAQFHFVDLHPYYDGNGRMCRTLSKWILDPICPIPFPMFKSRENYISSLTTGRNDGNNHKYLTILLLESAIEYYREVLKPLTRGYSRSITLQDLDELVSQAKEIGITDEGEVGILGEAYSNTQDYRFVDVAVTIDGFEVIIRLHRYPGISLEDL